MSKALKEAHATGIFSYSLLEDATLEHARPADRSFATGSKILLADGNTKPIEKLIPSTSANPNVGDVLLTLDGVHARVVGLMKGPEKSPLVTLKCEVTTPSHAGTILEGSINESHAMLKDQSHLVAASRLRKNDKVQTIYGEAQVLLAERMEYTDVVWNLFLASDHFVTVTLPNLDETRLLMFLWNFLLGLTPKQHLIAADGIISGDWNLQEQLDSYYLAGVSLSTFA